MDLTPKKVLGPFKSMNVSIKHRVEATPKLFKTYRLIEHKRVLRLHWDHYRPGESCEPRRATASLLELILAKIQSSKSV